MTKAFQSCYVETFLEMLVAERGLAANTIEAYERDLTEFATFCNCRGTEPVSASPQDLSLYMTKLCADAMSASTQARRLSALKQYYKFLQAESIRRDNPSTILQSPKKRQHLPKILSEAQVTLLLETAAVDGSAKGLRLTALLEVLYATGLRVSELISLPLSSVMDDREVLIVQGKGNKERMVPIGQPAKQAVKAYKRVRSSFLRGFNKSYWLFPSNSKITVPAFIGADQNSTLPFPFPIRFSVGFCVTGMCGKIVIHNLPFRFRLRFTHCLIDSIWRAVIRVASKTLIPYLPNFSMLFFVSTN